MRRVSAVTALSVVGVLLAAGTAAALNAQVLGGPARSSVGTADTLLPDDPFTAPGVDSSGSPSDFPSVSAEPSQLVEASETPSASPSRPSQPVSPSSVPSTGGASSTRSSDDNGGSSGSSGSSGSGSSGSGSDDSGGGDDKPDDD